MVDLLPIRLLKNPDLSVTGCLPDGKIFHWPRYVRNRPTRRTVKVAVNCHWWLPVWVAADQLTPSDPLVTKNPVSMRISA